MQPSHRSNNCSKYIYTPVAYRAHCLLRNYIECYYSSSGEHSFIEIQLGPLIWETAVQSLGTLYSAIFFRLYEKYTHWRWRRRHKDLNNEQQVFGTAMAYDTFWQIIDIGASSEAAPGWSQESDMD